MPRKPKKQQEAKRQGNPRENIKEHRDFLARALERNDTEINALVELNKTLHKAKENIMQSCGELVLLDMGAGKLTLINDELHEEKMGEDDEVHHLTPAQKDLCVDFLLRMKLRRKLSNRLARRLNRIAHFMDGEDVFPPYTPRYGDLSLNIDIANLHAREKQWNLQKGAKERVSKAHLLKKEEGMEVSAVQVETTLTAADVTNDGEGKEPSEDTKMDQDGDDDQGREEEKSEELEKSADSEKKETEPSSSSAGDKAETSVDSTPPSKSGPSEKDPDAIESSTETYSRTDESKSIQESQLDMDREFLKEYDAAYEKVWDSGTKTFKYSILNQKNEPDHTFIRGLGIGATTTRPMSAQEREVEYLRWQTNVLGQIPNQPTFEELGLQHNVFCLEERRKRCLEENSEDEPAQKKKKVDSGDEVEPMDVEDEDGSEKKGGNGGAKAKTKDSKKSKTESPSKKNADKEDEGTNQVEEDDFKEIKPMSLKAIPSFHEQDMRRVRQIHADLVVSSIFESARQRLMDATREYNNSLTTSNKYYSQRQTIQTKITYFVATSRNQLAKMNNDYALQVAIAKQRWLKQKQKHDTARIKTVMPSSYGHPPLGTATIQNFCRHPNQPNGLTIGSCLADIVDASIMISEGKMPASKKFEDFIPPVAPVLPNGETVAQQHSRTENSMRKDLNIVNTKYLQSEEGRKRYWRKLMKLRTEVEVPLSAGRRPHNYTHMTMPPLRSSTIQSLPHLNYGGVRPARYTPTTRPVSESKYSAEKVRKRIAADGSVAPVSETKKTKDGLYLRPAGRTRKGMQWDDVRGIWMPEGQQMSS